MPRLRDKIATTVMLASLPISLFAVFSVIAAAPNLHVSGIAQPGLQLVAAGSDFPRNDRIQLTWDGSASGMPLIRSDRTGSFQSPVTVPQTATVGDHLLAAGSVQPGKGKGSPKQAAAAGVLASVVVHVLAPTSSATPTPSPTVISLPSPTPTPTASPTPTPRPSATSTPTPTPTLTAKPTPSPSPKPSTSADPMIAAAGDIACATPYTPTTTTCQHAAVAQLLSSAATVLTLGDNQYETGMLAQFNASYDPSWGVYKTKTRPSVGNHEYGTSNAQGYRDYFGVSGPLYYSYDVGAWHLIALDSNCSSGGGCASGTAQFNWLVADLAAHPNACVLAYWHHPRFSTGQHGNNATYQSFWQALYDANADLILNGHDHDYERFAPQTPTGTADNARGIREFVVGTGGESHYTTTGGGLSEAHNSATFGVLRLTLHPTSYDWSFVPAVGTFTENGSGKCH